MSVSRMLIAVEMIGIIVSVIGIVVGMVSKGVDNKNWKPISLAIMGSLLVFSVIVSWVVNTYTIPDEYAGKSKNELLQKADEYYKAKQYLQAANIYNLNELDTDSVALNNMAYFYEKGLGVSKDLSKACDLYERAKNLGNTTAAKNWIIFNIQNPRSYIELIETLEYGKQNGDENASEWISWFSKSTYPNDFFEAGIKAQKKAIQGFMYKTEVPVEYYDGINGSEFISTIMGTDNKTCFTGAYSVTQLKDGTIEEHKPILVKVNAYIFEVSKFTFADNYQTSYIGFS